MKLQNTKRILCCILSIVMMFLLLGCGEAAPAEPEVQAEAAPQAAPEGEKRIEVTPPMAYEDAVFNREMVEGKFAVYYLTSGLAISSWKNQTAGGDLMILIFPDGKTGIIDCGHQGEAAHMVNRLKQLGISKLDFFIASHPHTDHLGGYRTILRNLEVGHVYIPPMELMERGDLITMDFINELNRRGIPYTELVEGDEFDITTDVHVKVYNPTREFAAITTYNVNEASLLLKFTYKDSSFLFNGDIANNTVKANGYPTEEELVKRWGDELQADVVKTGHHGNGDAMSTDVWRDAVDAKIYTTLSTFPRSLAEHILWRDAAGCSLNTALDGDFVIFTSGDGTYEVQVSKDRISDGYELLDTTNGYMKVD